MTPKSPSARPAAGGSAPSVAAPRGIRQSFVGVVVSDRMSKTIIVKVERLVRHARVGKYLKRYTKYVAHDEREEAGVGDRVEIMETRPLSRTKRWRLVRILAPSADSAAAAPATVGSGGAGP